MPNYELLITGGTVLDPANNRHEIADIAIDDGKIVRVEPDIDHDLASQVINATDQWSCPG
jgi:dihydroorotase